jgi:hypothetical protein
VTALETAAATAAGLGLIGLAGRDIFDALFHPEGRATLGRFLARAVWLAFRRVWPDVGRLPLAGPVALLTVIGSWAALLAVGWALLYLPHLPDGFRGTDGGGFVDALYMSLVTLTTLGFGDVTPTADWLRLITPLEALLGFGLLSASISWLLLIYPVLGRRRSLAYEISLLRTAEQETGEGVEQLEGEAGERVLAELTTRLIAVERDLVNFPITYYFAESDERFAMPTAAPYLRELAERGQRDHAAPRARLRARLLSEAIDDFAATTAERFHGTRAESTDELLRAYARDHLRSH